MNAICLRVQFLYSLVSVPRKDLVIFREDATRWPPTLAARVQTQLDELPFRAGSPMVACNLGPRHPSGLVHCGYSPCILSGDDPLNLLPSILSQHFCEAVQAPQDIADEHLFALHPTGRDDAIEQLARRADEWLALRVL